MKYFRIGTDILLSVFVLDSYCLKHKGYECTGNFLLSFAHRSFATLENFLFTSSFAIRDAGIIVIREKHVTCLKTKRSPA